MALSKFFITDTNSPPPGKLFIKLDLQETDADSLFGGNAISAYIEIDIPTDLLDTPTVKMNALNAIQAFCVQNGITYNPNIPYAGYIWSE